MQTGHVASNINICYAKRHSSKFWPVASWKVECKRHSLMKKFVIYGYGELVYGLTKNR
jgi:hypothetical protein